MKIKYLRVLHILTIIPFATILYFCFNGMFFGVEYEQKRVLLSIGLALFLTTISVYIEAFIDIEEKFGGKK